MSVTQEDLTSFTKFATVRLSAGEVGSIRQLAEEWEAVRHEMDSVAQSVRESENDIRAGRVHAADEVFADVRAKLGLDQ